MSTRITVKGQVTLPKAVRETAGIHPGDNVTARARAEGGVIVEHEASDEEDAAYLERLQEIIDRRPFQSGPYAGMSTDEIMRILRGDD